MILNKQPQKLFYVFTIVLYTQITLSQLNFNPKQLFYNFVFTPEGSEAYKLTKLLNAALAATDTNPIKHSNPYTKMRAKT